MHHSANRLYTRILSPGLPLILILTMLAIPTAADSPVTRPPDRLQPRKIDRVKPPDVSRIGRVPCLDGQVCAGTTCFPCRNIDYLSHVPLRAMGSATSANDLWGWTDPTTGHEYALVGLNNGTAFVDITDPIHPRVIGHLPTQTVSSAWRDIKVFDHYALIVSEAAAHGMQVFDLNRLRTVMRPPITFTPDAVYNGRQFNHAHNIAVNELTGFAYLVGTDSCNGGLHMVDIRRPLHPVFAGCFGADGYTHDVQCVLYHGPDVEKQGREICFAANEDTLTLVDVTDKTHPTLIQRVTYPGVGFTHQGWLTEDHRYFILNDELDEMKFGHPTRTRIFDVTDLHHPFLAAVHDGPTPATDHNLYVRGRFVYEANYRAGLWILLWMPGPVPHLRETAYFDTYPLNDNPGFNGAWNVYPFFDSGVVIVSDIEQGLFVLAPTLTADFTTRVR